MTSQAILLRREGIGVIIPLVGQGNVVLAQQPAGRLAAGHKDHNSRSGIGPGAEGESIAFTGAHRGIDAVQQLNVVAFLRCRGHRDTKRVPSILSLLHVKAGFRAFQLLGSPILQSTLECPVGQDFRAHRSGIGSWTAGIGNGSLRQLLRRQIAGDRFAIQRNAAIAIPIDFILTDLDGGRGIGFQQRAFPLLHSDDGNKPRVLRLSCWRDRQFVAMLGWRFRVFAQHHQRISGDFQWARAEKRSPGGLRICLWCGDLKSVSGDRHGVEDVQVGSPGLRSLRGQPIPRHDVRLRCLDEKQVPRELKKAGLIVVSRSRFADHIVGLGRSCHGDKMSLIGSSHVSLLIEPHLVIAALSFAADRPGVLIVRCLDNGVCAGKANAPRLVRPEDKGVCIRMRMPVIGRRVLQGQRLFHEMLASRRAAMEGNRRRVILPTGPRHHQAEVGKQPDQRKIVQGLGRNGRIDPDEREGRFVRLFPGDLAGVIDAIDVPQLDQVSIMIFRRQFDQDLVFDRMIPALRGAVAEVRQVGPVRHRGLQEIIPRLGQERHVEEILARHVAQGIDVIEHPGGAVAGIGGALVITAIPTDVLIRLLENGTGVVEPGLHLPGVNIVERHGDRRDARMIDPAVVLEISGVPPIGLACCGIAQQMTPFGHQLCFDFLALFHGQIVMEPVIGHGQAEAKMAATQIVSPVLPGQYGLGQVAPTGQVFGIAGNEIGERQLLQDAFVMTNIAFRGGRRIGRNGQGEGTVGVIHEPATHGGQSGILDLFLDRGEFAVGEINTRMLSQQIAFQLHLMVRRIKWDRPLGGSCLRRVQGKKTRNGNEDDKANEGGNHGRKVSV